MLVTARAGTSPGFQFLIPLLFSVLFNEQKFADSNAAHPFMNRMPLRFETCDRIIVGNFRLLAKTS